MGEVLCGRGVGHGDSFGPDGGQGREVAGCVDRGLGGRLAKGRHRSRCGCAFGGGNAISPLKRWS